MTARDWTIEKLENDWISIQVGREAPFRVHSSSVDSSQPTGYFVVAARFSKGTAGGVTAQRLRPRAGNLAEERKCTESHWKSVMTSKSRFLSMNAWFIAGLVSEKTFKKSFNSVIQRLNCARNVAVSNLKECDSNEIDWEILKWN